MFVIWFVVIPVAEKPPPKIKNMLAITGFDFANKILSKIRNNNISKSIFFSFFFGVFFLYSASQRSVCNFRSQLIYMKLAN